MHPTAAITIARHNDSKFIYHKEKIIIRIFIEQLKRMMREGNAIRIQLVSCKHKCQQEQIVSVLAKDMDKVIYECLKYQTNIIEVIIYIPTFEQFRLGDKILKQNAGKWRSLIILEIDSCMIGNKGVKILKDSRINILAKLDLDNNAITKEGAKLLSFCDWKLLEQLNISKNSIGNKGIEYLAKANWPSLKQISFYACSNTGDFLRAIIKANWPNLQHIYFAGTPSTILYTYSLKMVAKQIQPCSDESYEIWGSILRQYLKDYYVIYWKKIW